MRPAKPIIDLNISSAVTRPQCERLATLARGKLVLELGSWLGRSTVLLASVAEAVHAVDWHRGDAHTGTGDTLGACVQSLRKHNLYDKVVLHVGRNEDVLPFFKDGLFDLIFVDSFHAEEYVEQDIELTRRLLSPGGIMAFHDYGTNHFHNGIQFGVTPAVDRLAKRENWPIETVECLAILKSI
jgi:predicted O-methyltransferase YrrM